MARTAVAIVGYFTLCSACWAWCIGNAFHTVAGLERGEDLWALYRSGPNSVDFQRALALVVEDLKSSGFSLFVLLNLFPATYAMAAQLTTWAFLGRLSPRESARISERLIKYAVFKLVFMGAVITAEMSEGAAWLAWFAAVGFIKMFTGAAKDRLEALMVSPQAKLHSHLRALALLLLMLAANVAAAAALMQALQPFTATKLLLCAFDTASIALQGGKTLFKYAVNSADALLGRLAVAAPLSSAGRGLGSSWEAWEGKGSLLYHTELLADLVTHAMTLAHYIHVWFLHGLSFHLTDAILFLDIRSVALSLQRRLRGHLSYRRVTHSLQHAFPDVSPADAGGGGGGGGAASDDYCTICRERLAASAKQLPCGHVFHLACLRAWLQQSGTEHFSCPNCRKPLFVATSRSAAAGAGSSGIGLGGGGDDDDGGALHHPGHGSAPGASAPSRPGGWLSLRASALRASQHLVAVLGPLAGVPPHDHHPLLESLGHDDAGGGLLDADPLNTVRLGHHHHHHHHQQLQGGGGGGGGVAVHLGGARADGDDTGEEDEEEEVAVVSGDSSDDNIAGGGDGAAAAAAAAVGRDGAAAPPPLAGRASASTSSELVRGGAGAGAAGGAALRRRRAQPGAAGARSVGVGHGLGPGSDEPETFTGDALPRLAAAVSQSLTSVTQSSAMAVAGVLLGRSRGADDDEVDSGIRSRQPAAAGHVASPPSVSRAQRRGQVTTPAAVGSLPSTSAAAAAAAAVAVRTPPKRGLPHTAAGAGLPPHLLDAATLQLPRRSPRNAARQTAVPHSS